MKDVQNNGVSVIVVTKNRPNLLDNCVKSLALNTHSAYEIIVIDQGNKYPAQSVCKKYSSKVRYFHQSSTGHTKGRNLGIQYARYSILSFTDDDCVVSRNWVTTVYRLFDRNKNISAIFGSSLYDIPNNTNTIPISCLRINKEKVYTNPPTSHLNIRGNNMHIRKQVFHSCGMFQEWLGIGSPSYAADDLEMAYRILRYNLNILVTPTVWVKHTHFLPLFKAEMLKMKYGCGFWAACSFHSTRGDSVARTYLLNEIITHIRSWNKSITLACRHLSFKYGTFLMFVVLFQTYYFIRGTAIGVFHAKIRPQSESSV
jgi:glycosyltransferase involved in cell wall biosynthesis